ncbi:hypothetical protein IT072_16255 [Leifsonia sp. ZF2019]|uniref:hypothetical protein n=1 Tax=Leifsonia sp. ZF2019 TaxID=2781978 RepID=UPI001CBFE368|nr:hypothetical protein [Leifsonia sp. ZF2019]UAJ78768.1 hypothetical protein IT072_16255 [Leifsonia sp. ZF2019]
MTLDIEPARCTRSSTGVRVEAATSDLDAAVRTQGSPAALDGLIARFDDAAFVTIESLTLRDGSIEMDGVSGQINEWADGSPGSVIADAATVSGRIVCAAGTHL